MVPWLSFVWAAVVAACTAGFGYGAAAFAVIALGVPAGGWWPALVQAHGHVQVFGWGGLMVLGVGFHFLPRLRGAPLAHPRLVPWILGLMVFGLCARGMVEPLAAAFPWPPFALGLVASGGAELAGGTAAVLVLAATARSGPSLEQRRGLTAVLRFLVFGFLSFLVGLATNGLLLVWALAGPTAPASSAWDDVVTLLGLDGFLVPVSVAVAARSFPLFLWTVVPSTNALRVGFWTFAAGLALRALGPAVGPWVVALGTALEGSSLIAFTAMLRVLPLGRRQGMRVDSDPHYLRSIEYLLVPAFIWLAISGVLQVEMAVSSAGLAIPAFPDAERHALGTGFVTLLILGMGQRMLPGFAGREIASRGLIWATVVLGNSSAILRVGPVIWTGLGLATTLGGHWVALASTLSGILGLGAIACFATNLALTFRGRQLGRGRNRTSGTEG